MKYYIKFFFGILVSFLFIWIMLKQIHSPSELKRSASNLIYRNKTLAHFFKLNRNKQITIGDIGAYVKPIVKTSLAIEKKTVYYKGRKITVITNDTNEDISEPILEFLYKLELEKEKAKTMK